MSFLAGALFSANVAVASAKKQSQKIEETEIYNGGVDLQREALKNTSLPNNYRLNDVTKQKPEIELIERLNTVLEDFELKNPELCETTESGEQIITSINNLLDPEVDKRALLKKLKSDFQNPKGSLVQLLEKDFGKARADKLISEINQVFRKAPLPATKGNAIKHKSASFLNTPKPNTGLYFMPEAKVLHKPAVLSVNQSVSLALNAHFPEACSRFVFEFVFCESQGLEATVFFAFLLYFKAKLKKEKKSNYFDRKKSKLTTAEKKFDISMSFFDRKYLNLKDQKDWRSSFRAIIREGVSIKRYHYFINKKCQSDLTAFLASPFLSQKERAKIYKRLLGDSNPALDFRTKGMKIEVMLFFKPVHDEQLGKVCILKVVNFVGAENME